MTQLVYKTATPTLLKEHSKKGFWLHEAALQKVLITGGSGSGKTLMAGRHIIFPLFVANKPIVVLDPLGTLSDTIIWKFLMQPEGWQRQNLHRLKYVNKRPTVIENVLPTPLYYRMADYDSLATIGRRPLDMFIKSDPSLANAPILGLNQLETVGTYVGMACAALGLQITEVPDLLRKPGIWLEAIEQAGERNPDLIPVLEYFRGLSEVRKREQLEMQTRSFLSKIEKFCLDPVLKTMYGCSKHSIDWEQVVADNCLVIFDYRHVTNIQERIFASQVDLNNLLDYIKYRGYGRHKPVYMAIDELAALFPVVGLAAEQLAADLDALINQYARNYRLFLCPLTTQELYQYSHYPKLAKTLLSMNSQFHGVTSDPESARILAERFYRYDPEDNRRFNPVYMSSFGVAKIIDWTPVPFSVEEQVELKAHNFLNLKPFEFYARVSHQEGSIQSPLVKVSIRDLDRDLYPDFETVKQARRLLSQSVGVSVKDGLLEIADRLRKFKARSSQPFDNRRLHKDDRSDIPPFELVDPILG